jgi:DNA-binding CsgD family transcriptional regulator
MEIDYNNFSNSGKYYIYTLTSPLQEEIVKYVGYTNKPNERYNKHINSYKHGVSKVKTWIKSLQFKNIKPTMIIIDEFDTVEEVKEAEIGYIKLYKSIGANLKNHTLGGEGIVGYRHTEETKQKISKAGKGRTITRNISKEDREKINISLRVIKNENIDKLKLLFNEGKTAKEIGNYFKITESTVIKYYKRLGLKFTEERPLYIKDFVKKSELYKLYITENKTKKEISEILGMTERNIKKRLLDFKIKKSEEQVKEIYFRLINERKSINDELGKMILKDRIEEKMKLKEVALKYNLKPSTVNNYIYKNINNKTTDKK